MEEKEKNEKSEQTLRNLGRKELIMRLKEMANAEVLPMEERPMGAMCYSISLPEPIYTFVCPKCGRTVENLRRDPHVYLQCISLFVKEINELGYDAKIEQACLACSGIDHSYDPYDWFPYDVNILFYFRFKGEETYHKTIANNWRMYEAVLAFLRDKNEYFVDHGDLMYVSENQAIIEKMLGIKI